jgi:hypothetical protein
MTEDAAQGVAQVRREPREQEPTPSCSSTNTHKKAELCAFMLEQCSGHCSGIGAK